MDRPIDFPRPGAGHSQFEAIRYRFPGSGMLYRWKFQRDGKALTVDPPGS
jgi:hypothetical protein